MANLKPSEAAELILTGEGYFFWLRGNGFGKGFWSESVKEHVDLPERSLTVLQFGNHTHGIKDPGGIYNECQYYRPDGIIAISANVGQIEERKARGLAILLNKRFVIVDNFLSEEDRLLVPVIEPVTSVDYSIPAAIIVDLDGTLADSSQRSPFNATFEEIMEDRVIQHVADLVGMNFRAGRKVLFVSGRGNSAGEFGATETWLAVKLGIEPGHSMFRLFTREVGDNRDDVIVKLEIFNKHIRDKYDVKLVLDDRPKVIRMWTELGLPVLANRAYIRGEF